MYAQWIHKSLAGVVFALAATTSLASDYPAKPVVLVAPYAAGGNADITARTLAEHLAPKLGQPVIVENRPGAGTMLAAEHVARSAPDGYTLLLTGSSVVVAPVLNKSKRYDPLKSFEAVAGVAFAHHILVVPATSPVRTVKDLVAQLKAAPGKHSYASVGMGATNHLEAELLQSMTGTSMIHVPYKGSAPALVDLLAGRIDMMFDAYSSSKPFIDQGRLRVLGVSSAERAKSMPDVPSISEAGVPGFNAIPWLGISAPAGTPPKVLEKLNTALREVINSPLLQARLKELGMDPMDMSQREFSRFIEDNAKVWLDVINSASISIAGN